MLISPLELRLAGDFFQHTTPKLGVLHSIAVPVDACERFIWLAADVLDADTDANWWLKGSLKFWMQENQICEWPFSAGSRPVPGQDMNFYSPKTGSGAQPALVITAYDSTDGKYRKMDAPCFAFRVTCDRITYEATAMHLGSGAISDIILDWEGFNIDGPIVETITPALGGAAFEAIYDAGADHIAAVFLTDGGSGYTSAPAVNIGCTVLAGGSAPIAHAKIRWSNIITGLAVASQYPWPPPSR